MLLVFLVGCGGGTSAKNDPKETAVCKTQPSALLTNDVDYLSRKILFNAPMVTVDIDRIETFKSSANANYFVPYDIQSGMSYVYGFEVADYLCGGYKQVSFFESYSKARTDFKNGVSVNGYLAFFQKIGGIKIEKMSAEDDFLDIWPKLQTDTLLIERGVNVDLNSDGYQDIVKVGNFPGGIFAYINPRSAGRGWEKRLINSDMVKGPVNIVSADINDDGLADFVVSGRKSVSGNPVGNHMLAYFLRDPTSFQWKAHSLPQADSLGDIRALLIDDFDGDGKKDIIFSDVNSGDLYAIYNLVNSSSRMEKISNDILMYQAHYGQVFNISNTEKAVLLPSYMSVNMLVYEAGRWVVRKIVNIKPFSKSITVTDAKAIDIDSDGEIELIFSIAGSSNYFDGEQFGGIYVYKPSVGVFRIIRESSYIAMFDSIDFDGDGRLDLIYNNEYPRNSISVLVNQIQ